MDIREQIDLVEASTRPAKLETTPLPYTEKALEPVMSKETIDYHYEHLAKGYAKRYNAGEGDLDFNRARCRKIYPARSLDGHGHLFKFVFKVFIGFKVTFN